VARAAVLGRLSPTVVNPQRTSLGGVDVEAFDRLSHNRDGYGNTHLVQSACVRFWIGSSCPRTIISARGSGAEAATIGLQAVVLTDDDVDRTFHVVTTDPAFVSAFLAPPMRDWFVADLRLQQVTLDGTEVVVAFAGHPTMPGEPPNDPDLSLGFVLGFVERLPDALASASSF
jgi:hypothetical protein